jgi:beta-fructofuranosidase
MNPLEKFRNIIQNKDKKIFAEAARQLRLWMIANDPYYPVYHFTGPEGWINDPNGPIFYRGQYHLFYQFDPIVEGRRSPRCWGHAVSKDLVHWEDWPVALWPDTPYDHNGIYSGNTIIDDDGHLCAIYTGNVDGHKETYGILARSTDDGLTWQKKMVMDNRQRPNAISPVHWDGYLWREGKTWQQLIGGVTAGETRQGAAWLWSSTDLEHWRLETNIAPDLKFGEFWELPYLIPLDGKDLFMVGNGNPYWVGWYNREERYFRPDSLATSSIDNGNYYSFNPNMTDNQGSQGAQRRLMHGWVTGPPSPTGSVPYWQGAHSIPRVISIRDSRVWQEPIPEISVLRGAHFHFEDMEAPAPLPTQGDALELQATFGASSASMFGFKMCVSSDGSCFVRAFFDAQSGEFGVDGPILVQNIQNLELLSEHHTIKMKRQPSFLEAGQTVAMHIFLDRSIIEIYVNGCAYTARLFPPHQALGVELFSEGGSTPVQTIDIWKMSPMWRR